MEWLFPSIVATFAGTLVLTATYFYLYTHDRQKFLLIWGVGWLIYATRFAFMLLIVSEVFKESNPLLLIANQLCSLISGLILLHGTFVFTDKKTPKHWYVFTIVAALWILASSYFKLSFLWVTLPTYLFLGIIYIWTGIVFLKDASAQEAGKTITGWTFILWGIHKMDYPFLRPIAWFAPWGYLMGATMEIIVALGMLIIYFNNSREELQKSKEKLKESEAYLRTLIETIPDLIWLKDPEGVYLACNLKFERFFGAKQADILGKTDYEFVDKELADFFRKKDKIAMAAGKPSLNEEEITYADDGHRELLETIKTPAFDHDGNLIGVLGVARDITNRKKMEMELAQSHKMEAIGTLAGGIAHDFNNILAAILGYADMAMDDTPDHSPAKYQIKQVLKAGNRAKDLVQHILSFSRKEAKERSPVSIHLLVQDALKLLRASIPTTIEIKQNIEPTCGNILAEPTQIHQVIMNLCTNAAQSMDEDGGVMEVGLTSVQLSFDDLANEPKLKPGPYVQLTIKDSGIGIDHRYLDKIFDPYFTTKEVGKGSGMGLSVVHGIIKSHDGMVTVNSKPGEGTIFSVYFPSIARPIEEKTKDIDPLPTGKEKILIVDDEKSIVDMTKRRVERLGYQVTTKTSSTEALELFSSSPNAFDLIITDQTMPELTGEKLAKKLLKIRPDIPIIICTGYSSKIDAEKANFIGISAFIMKPVDNRELAKTLRQVLNSRTS